MTGGGNFDSWLSTELETNDVTGFVFYRGRWCEYSDSVMMLVFEPLVPNTNNTYIHLLSLGMILSGIMCGPYLQIFDRLMQEGSLSSSNHVRLYAICSEAQEEANQARKDWQLVQFTSVIGDVHNVIARHLQKTTLPTLHVTDCSKTFAEALDSCLTVERYPHGAVQPGVLIYVGTTPAFGWASVPTPSNLQGALHRPNPKEIWNHVQHCLDLTKEAKDFECSNGRNFGKTATCSDACRLTCGCSIL